MDIEGTISEFRDIIREVGVYMGGPTLQRLNISLNNLLTYIRELEESIKMAVKAYDKLKE